MPAVTKLFLPVVHVVSHFYTAVFLLTPQRTQRSQRGSRVKELMRGRTKNDIVHVVSIVQKATLPIVSNLNDILTMR